MAGAPSDYHRGEMEISEQEKTFHFVMGMTKWGSLVIAASLLWLTIWFCTDAGFFAGFVVAVIVTALGILVLREKKGDAH